MATMAFFLTAPFLQRLLLSVDFRMFFTAACSKSDLNQQGLEISTGFANASGFLLTGTLRVLRGKTSPRAEMLRGIKHRHVGPDFCKNADSSKSVIGCRGQVQQQFNLRKIVLSNLQNKGFEFCLMSFQRIHVAHE